LSHVSLDKPGVVLNSFDSKFIVIQFAEESFSYTNYVLFFGLVSNCFQNQSLSHKVQNWNITLCLKLLWFFLQIWNP